jgi:diaminopimelate decarboxylase
MAATTLTVYPEAASVDSGRLSVGGCDAVELAREFGTPAYVYAEDDLRARAREYVAALHAHHPGAGEVIYASKAFPCTAALRIFAEEGLACDVASGGELHLALSAGFPPDRIHLHGNAKSERELAMAVEAGVGWIVLDNHDDVDKLAAALGPGRPQQVLIRVTPEVEADTHAAILTGHAESKFGFSLADARALAIDPPEHLALAGLHVHIGSQLFALEPYREAIAALAELGDFPVYNLGGGMAAAYTRDDRPPGADASVAAIVESAHALLGRDKVLMIEPGRSLVANAGVTLYRVESVKGEFVAVDGGMSDNLRPMLYDAVYEADIADRLGDGSPFTVVGKHCESGDVLVEHASLRDPRRGDVLVTPVTGAYGHALANNYNGVPRPPVIFCSGGNARVVVRRETYDDLTARDR